MYLGKIASRVKKTVWDIFSSLFFFYSGWFQHTALVKCLQRILDKGRVLSSDKWSRGGVEKRYSLEIGVCSALSYRELSEQQ